jgi:hypothetical protein
MGDRLRTSMVAASSLSAARGAPVRILRLADPFARREGGFRIVTCRLGDPLPRGPVKIRRIRKVVPYRKTPPRPARGRRLVSVAGELARPAEGASGIFPSSIPSARTQA